MRIPDRFQVLVTILDTTTGKTRLEKCHVDGLITLEPHERIITPLEQAVQAPEWTPPFEV